MVLFHTGGGRSQIVHLHRGAGAVWREAVRSLTPNNLAVAAMLLGLGVYLHAAHRPGPHTLGDYMVAMWGTDAEKQDLINDVAREQARLLHAKAFSDTFAH